MTIQALPVSCGQYRPRSSQSFDNRGARPIHRLRPFEAIQTDPLPVCHVRGEHSSAAASVPMADESERLFNLPVSTKYA